MSDSTQLVKKINDLQNQLEEALITISTLTKEVNALKLNEQRYQVANNLIPPGIACKVAYDAKGLILKSSPLVASDIPEIEIDNIKGLRSILDSKISSSQLNRIEDEFNKMTQKKSSNIFATGIKINYDKNGFVISHDELTVDDIPLMSIEKIEGLQDQLDMINTIITTVKNADEDKFSVEASTGCKVSYDTKGRVTGSSPLTMEDIPNELISKMNILESQIPSFASQKVVNGLVETISKKLDGNESIIPGVYTKVKVDSKGLITLGESLTMNDLPTELIDKLSELTLSFNNVAKHDEVVALNESVSTILNSLSKISDITSLQNSIDSKAPKEDVTNLIQQVSSLKTSFEEFVIKLPSDSILSQIETFTRELSNIDSRISVLEIKLGLHNLEE